MSSERSAPSKTFLLGEYVALDGGPSIILSTAPRFRLRITDKKPVSKGVAKPPFAPQSPAGRFLAKLGPKTAGFEFTDPHHGQGGLGASSAQFALVYSWAKRLESSDGIDWAALLAEYRACASSGEGTPPSGADVVAQLFGGICYFDGRSMKAERLRWEFPSLSFTLLRTGVKLATHEHLKHPQAAPHGALRECVALARNAFLEKDESSLVAAVERCGAVLGEAGLTASATVGLLRALRTQASGVRAAKGCGAMGSDVIAVLHDRDALGSLAKWVESKGLETCGNEATLEAEGLKVE